MRIVIGGTGGLIGSALVDVLTGDGHTVVRLVRRDARHRDEVSWDPAAGRLDAAALGRVDAAINLGGTPIGSIPGWLLKPEEQKTASRDSRVDATRLLATTLAALPEPPAVLLSGSAIGYYPFEDRFFDEEDGPGDHFMARLCQDWEAATQPAEAAGIRVCHLRSGIVLSRRGGALGMLVPIFSLGLGGPIGDGKQRWSWIALADHLRATRFLLTHDEVSGPVNLAAPRPVSDQELTRLLGAELNRPTLLPVPPFALRMVFKDYADQLLLTQQVRPTKLLDAGFTFRYPDPEDGVRAALAD